MKKALDSFLGLFYDDELLLSQEAAELEKLLTEQLTPVSPRPGYVSNLSKKLSVEAKPAATNKRQRATQMSPLEGVLLALIGVVSGTVLVLLGVRTVLIVISALGMLHQVRISRRQLRLRRMAIHPTG